MGNNRSRIVPTRPLRITDSQTRARYQNQRELIQLRRKLTNINIKHTDALTRLAINRHDARVTLHELKHETGQRELRKRLEKYNEESSTSFLNTSELLDDSNTSTLECPSLLLHNLNASNEWEKSFIFPNRPYGISKSTSSFKASDHLRSQYSSKLDASSHSFTQTESFLLSDSSSLRQETERMKRSIKMAVAKSARDSKTATRRNAHKY